MSALCVEDDRDLPYGPGNCDYEYDSWRQQQDLEEREQQEEAARKRSRDTHHHQGEQHGHADQKG